MKKGKENLHIQYDICSNRVVHKHFRGKLYRQTFQVFLIFHMHIAEEAYYPSHRSQNLEAELEVHTLSVRKNEWYQSHRKGGIYGFNNLTCLTSLYKGNSHIIILTEYNHAE